MKKTLHYRFGTHMQKTWDWWALESQVCVCRRAFVCVCVCVLYESESTQRSSSFFLSFIALFLFLSVNMYWRRVHTHIHIDEYIHSISATCPHHQSIRSRQSGLDQLRTILWRYRSNQYTARLDVERSCIGFNTSQSRKFARRRFGSAKFGKARVIHLVWICPHWKEKE